MDQQVDPRWRKSTHSGSGGEASIEAGAVAGRVLLRDPTQHGNGPIVSVSQQSWRRLIASIRGDAPIR